MQGKIPKLRGLGIALMFLTFVTDTANAQSSTKILDPGYCCEPVLNSIDELKAMIDYVDSTNKALEGTNKGYLVTPYTYFRQEAKDFASILTGENAFTGSSRFAFLKVDEENSKVSFAPFAFESRNSLDYKKGARFNGNIGFNFAVDNEQIFTIFDKNGLNGDAGVFLNFNLIVSHKRFYSGGGRQLRKATSLNNLSADIESLKDPIGTMNDFRQKYLDCLDSYKCNDTNKCKLCCNDDEEEIKDALWGEFADCENKLAKKYWTWDMKTWVTLTTEYRSSSENLIDTNTLILQDTTYRSFSGKLTLNTLIKWTRFNNSSLYLKAWGGIDNRSIFTEMQASDWNQTQTLSDSTHLLIDQKSAYLYDPASYRHKYCPSAGLQAIAMINFGELWFLKQFSVGIDAQYQYMDIPPITIGGNNINKNNAVLGIIIPFTDKDGDNSINIEVFRSSTRYTANTFEKKDFWGVKFSVPIL